MFFQPFEGNLDELHVLQLEVDGGQDVLYEVLRGGGRPLRLLAAQLPEAHQLRVMFRQTLFPGQPLDAPEKFN